MRKCLRFLAVSLLGVITSGCATTARITANQMPKLDNPHPENLTVLAQATDARRGYKVDQVGRHTFTVFMIPTFAVHSEAALGKEVGGVFVNALKESGYKVEVVDSIADASGPVLTLQIDSINNYLFSWLYPLGLTFGKAQFTPVLFGEDDKILWNGKPTSAWGGCPSLVYMCGFETSIKTEVSSILRNIIEQLNTPEFIAAASPQSSGK